MPHPFRKESGPGLSEDVDQYIGQALDVARPQLGLIKEQFFNGAFGPPESFRGVLTFPFVAGYVLGLMGAFLDYKRVTLSERDKLASVVQISNSFMINDCDCQISLHYVMQQPIYNFGLDVGASEFAISLADRAQGRPIQFVMLAQFLMTFIQYADDRTLQLNLELLGKALSLPPQDYVDHVRRWNVQKDYSFRVD